MRREASSPAPADQLAGAPVVSSEVVHHGRVWDLVREQADLDAATGPVDLGEGRIVREFLRHPGAVGVLVLDDADRVLLLRQYRHPVGHVLWEVPAGLLDVPGEPPHAAAARELAEEADLRAGEWHVLLDWFLSPGGSSEAFRLFVARDPSPVPQAERHVRTDEEAGMVPVWVDFDEAVEAVLAGRLHSPSVVVGLLAAQVERARGWSGLRPADAPWPEHPAYR